MSDIQTPFTGCFAGKRAKVMGLALEPVMTPSLFEQLGLADRLTHVVGDIRSREPVSRVLAQRCTLRPARRRPAWSFDRTIAVTVAWAVPPASPQTRSVHA